MFAPFVELAVPSSTQREAFGVKRARPIARLSSSGFSVIVVLLHEVSLHSVSVTPGCRISSFSTTGLVVFGNRNVSFCCFASPRLTSAPLTWLQVNEPALTDGPPSSVTGMFWGTVTVASSATTLLANAILASACWSGLTVTTTLSVDVPAGPFTVSVNS